MKTSYIEEKKICCVAVKFLEIFVIKLSKVL